MKNCTNKSNRRLFVFEENRSKFTLENTDLVESIEIKVDNCEITSGKRCDALHRAKGYDRFIELKGQDIKAALEQIEATIPILREKGNSIKSYIICTRNPLISSEIQNLKKKHRTKFNSELIIHSSGKTEKY